MHSYGVAFGVALDFRCDFSLESTLCHHGSVPRGVDLGHFSQWLAIRAPGVRGRWGMFLGIFRAARCSSGAPAALERPLPGLEHEQLEEARRHRAVAGLPLLPAAQRGLHRMSGFGLREAGGNARVADGGGRGARGLVRGGHGRHGAWRLRARVEVPRAFYVQCAYRRPARDDGTAGLRKAEIR